MEWDVIVVGAGHNGLIAAGYLARAGKRVLVLEQREIVGGACVTEEVWPGYHVSTGAYLCSLLLPEVVRDLELERYGFSVYRRETAGFAPFPDGRALLLYADAAHTRASLEQFCAASPDDVAAFFQFEEDVARAADILEPLLNAEPPSVSALRQAFVDAEAEPLYAQFVVGSVRELLDARFQDAQLKAVLATDGLIGTYGGPSTPGTAYVLLHHYLGRVLGNRGAWGYVRGGMGSITQALARSLEASGGTIRTAAPVKRILTATFPAPDAFSSMDSLSSKGETKNPATNSPQETWAPSAEQTSRVVGVELENGEVLHAPVVLSNADPYRTFSLLLDTADMPETTPSSAAAITPAWHRLKTCGGASVKINLAVSELPQFRGWGTEEKTEGETRRQGDKEKERWKTEDGRRKRMQKVGIRIQDSGFREMRKRESNPQSPIANRQSTIHNPQSTPSPHLGTVHLCPDMDYLERAWEEARQEIPSTEPMIEMYMQTATDPSLAPPGGHMVSLFVQYFPYNLAPGLDLETERAHFTARVFGIVEQYAPGFTASILHQQTLTPRDLEARFGLTGGHIFHGDLLPPNLWDQRGQPHARGAKTPVAGLYLCGSGAHPGGCVYGAPGVNAANTVINTP